MWDSFKFGSHIRERPLTEEEANRKMTNFLKQESKAPPTMNDTGVTHDAVEVVEDMDALFDF